MQNLAEEYTGLNTRLAQMKERRAVLASREADKERQRTELTAELTLMGVDVSNPAAEIQRLEAEALEDLRRAKEQVDQFERELNEAAAPARVIATDSKVNTMTVTQDPYLAGIQAKTEAREAASQEPAQPAPSFDGLPDLEIS